MEDSLTETHKKELLQLARETLDLYVRQKQVPAYETEDPVLLAERGAFTTLRCAGELRGCIGQVEGKGPLYRVVQAMTIGAASRDPRFPPLIPPELKTVSIELSVLTPMRPIESLEEIVVGEHGLLVSSPTHRGLLLPQVPGEHGWDRMTFVQMTCVKAGLPPEAYKEADVKIQVFSAEVFGT